MYLDWKTVKDFYLYNCTGNQDFLNKFNSIPRNNYDNGNYNNIYGDIIKNNDMVESTNQYDELK